jgi:hypothetical protein
MGDLMPDLAKFINEDGGKKSATWKYLAALDKYEKNLLKKRGEGVSNGVRAAVLYTAMAQKLGSREALGTFSKSLKIPKQTYFSAVLFIDSLKRLSTPPQRNKRRFVHNRDFPSVLDYNRIMLNAGHGDKAVLTQWEKAYNQSSKKEQGEKYER